MSIKLYIRTKDGSRRMLEFPGPEVSIGRAPDNEVVLDDLRSSRKHCRIMETPQGVLLEDLKSANGTILRGEAVQATFLEPGDGFQVGDTLLYFQEPPPGGESFEAGQPGNGEGDALLRRTLVATGEAPGARTTVAGTPCLEALEGPRRGETILLSRSPFTLGRSSRNDCSLRDPRASSRHARVLREGERWVLEDLGSTNGVLVNGRRVRRAVLAEGVRVTIGNSVFRAAGVGGPAPASVPPEEPEEPAWGGDLRSPVAVEGLRSRGGVEQPVAVVALVVIVGLLTYFGIDLARRVLIRRELDPAGSDNRVANWSFEETPPEGSTGIPGWEPAPAGAGRLELTEEQALYPGKRALRLEATGGEPNLVLARQSSPLALGARRDFLLEGFAANRGAFLAGLLVDWLQGGREGERLVGRSYSEAASDPAAVVNIYRAVRVPPGATHARVACFAYGAAGGAIFDRIALTPAASGEGAAAGREDERSSEAGGGGGDPAGGRDLEGVTLSCGPEGSRLVLELHPDGTLSLNVAGRALIPSLWGGLDASRDPLAFGPLLGEVVVRSGDRGAIALRTRVPAVGEGRFEEIEMVLAGGPDALGLRLRSGRGDPPAPAALVLESRSRDLPVVAHGPAGRRELTFAAAGDPESGPFEELALGELQERVSLTFLPPVVVSARPHPVVAGRWLLSVSPQAPGGELEVTLAHASRREIEAAEQVIREAEAAYREGRVAEALVLLERVAREFPRLEAEVRRAEAVRQRWLEDTRALLAELEKGVEAARADPSPVILENTVERVEEAARRQPDTEAGRRLERLAAGLRSLAEKRREARRQAADRALLKRAQEDYPERLGWSELYLRALLESPPEESVAREARFLLDRIEKQYAR